MKLISKDKILFLIIGMLLFIRLQFFLKDQTNDTVETLLFIIIFVLSVYALVGVIKHNFIHTLQDKFYWSKVLVVIYLLIIDVTFQLHNSISIGFGYLFAVLFTIGIIVMISISLPRKLSFIYDIFIAFFACGYALGQDIYHQIFEGLFLLRDFATVKEGADFVNGVYTFSIFHLIYVVLFILFILLYNITIPRYIVQRKYKIKPLVKTIIIAFVLFHLNAVYPVKSARLHTSDHYLLYSNFSPLKVSSRFGLSNLFFRDAFSLFALSNSYEQEVIDINQYLMTYQKNHQTNEYSNLFMGKNLIFIVGESYDELALSKTLTPNLYQLKTEGLDFSNHYTPVYPRTTCDTEIIFNTGLIPSINEGPTCYEFNHNSYHNSLASLFRESNYRTTALHSNYEEFYTREIIYPKLGYDQFLGQNALNLSDTDIRFDTTFMEKSLPYINQNTSPYFTFMITLSGHSPYSDSNIAAKKHYHLVDSYYGNTMLESVKYYIATQVEVDRMVGRLITHLTTTNQLNNTVILFTNDHYPYTLNSEDYEQVKHVKDIHEKQKGALYIWNSDLAPAKIDTLSSSFDLVPTLMNLFGLKGEYTQYLGNDIFDSSSKRIVYFKDYYIKYKDSFYDLSSSDVEIDDDTYQYALETYEYSVNVLLSNYYKNK